MYLVLDPMGETLNGFPTLWDPAIVPPRVAKRFTQQLLLALEYVHGAGVIHTGGCSPDQPIYPSSPFLAKFTDSHMQILSQTT